jgi:2-haloacid dehalogenase
MGTGATLAATANPALTVNSLAELADLHKSTQSKVLPLASTP